MKKAGRNGIALRQPRYERLRAPLLGDADLITSWPTCTNICDNKKFMEVIDYDLQNLNLKHTFISILTQLTFDPRVHSLSRQLSTQTIFSQ